MERTLNWIPRFDPKSLDYRISKLEKDTFRMGVVPRSRHWTRNVWLDQGSEGACVGFSVAHALALTPRRRPNITDDLARTLYREAQKRDEWEGENYEGSSVLGGMQAITDRGWTRAYYWATTLDEIIHGVSLFGPMVIGINWYSGMFSLDRDGYLNVTGHVAGGHAICVGGANLRTKTFRLDNSWGRSWGHNGSALLRFADMNRLLHEQGEAALPMKVRYAAPEQIVELG